MATQHAGLGPERWKRFTLGQQLLMIANEMSRGRSFQAPADRRLLDGCYERALRLTDLTVGVNPRRSLRRELLRWRDLLAELYIAEERDPARHEALFRVLLQLHPETHRQLPLLFPA